MQIEIGQRVTWRHQMRGGYGYVRNVPAVVREISVSGKRVLIEAQLERDEALIDAAIEKATDKSN